MIRGSFNKSHGDWLRVEGCDSEVDHRLTNSPLGRLYSMIWFIGRKGGIVAAPATAAVRVGGGEAAAHAARQHPSGNSSGSDVHDSANLPHRVFVCSSSSSALLHCFVFNLFAAQTTSQAVSTSKRLKWMSGPRGGRGKGGRERRRRRARKGRKTRRGKLAMSRGV